MVTICDNHEQSGNHHGYPWISIDIHGYLDIYIYILKILRAIRF